MSGKGNTMLIDLGNTSLKWALVERDKLGEVNRVAHHKQLLAHNFERLWGTIPSPRTVWVAAVAGQSLQDELQQWIERRWSVTARFMRTERSAAGVTCAYQQPRQLGVDRWAAMLAAYHYHPQGVCVLDCGTAITLDLVHCDGRHLGGFILPGFELMRQSLLTNTPITAVAEENSAGEWGDSTASCINLGVRKAVASLVESSIERFQAAGVCDPALILTGSSVEEVESVIEIDYEIREHLVLEGLFLYAGSEAA